VSIIKSVAFDLDFFGHRGKILRYTSPIDSMVCIKEDIEEEAKSTLRFEDSDIANADAGRSVFYWKTQIWVWYPQR